MMVFAGATHHPAPPALRVERRNNSLMATIVRYAEAMECHASAAQYLRDHCVPVEVARRVLITRRART